MHRRKNTARKSFPERHKYSSLDLHPSTELLAEDDYKKICRGSSHNDIDEFISSSQSRLSPESDSPMSSPYKHFSPHSYSERKVVYEYKHERNSKVSTNRTNYYSNHHSPDSSENSTRHARYTPTRVETRHSFSPGREVSVKHRSHHDREPWESHRKSERYLSDGENNNRLSEHYRNDKRRYHDSRESNESQHYSHKRARIDDSHSREDEHKRSFSSDNIRYHNKFSSKETPAVFRPCSPKEKFTAGSKYSKVNSASVSFERASPYKRSGHSSYDYDYEHKNHTSQPDSDGSSKEKNFKPRSQRENSSNKSSRKVTIVQKDSVTTKTPKESTQVSSFLPSSVLGSNSVEKGDSFKSTEKSELKESVCNTLEKRNISDTCTTKLDKNVFSTFSLQNFQSSSKSASNNSYSTSLTTSSQVEYKSQQLKSQETSSDLPTSTQNNICASNVKSSQKDKSSHPKESSRTSFKSGTLKESLSFEQNVLPSLANVSEHITDSSKISQAKTISYSNNISEEGTTAKNFKNSTDNCKDISAFSCISRTQVSQHGMSNNEDSLLSHSSTEENTSCSKILNCHSKNSPTEFKEKLSENKSNRETQAEGRLTYKKPLFPVSDDYHPMSTSNKTKIATDVLSGKNKESPSPLFTSFGKRESDQFQQSREEISKNAQILDKNKSHKESHLSQAQSSVKNDIIKDSTQSRISDHGSSKENHPPQTLSGKSVPKEKTVELKDKVSESKGTKEKQPTQTLSEKCVSKEKTAELKYKLSESKGTKEKQPTQILSEKCVSKEKTAELKDKVSESKGTKENLSPQTFSGKNVPKEKSAEMKDKVSESKGTEENRPPQSLSGKSFTKEKSQFKDKVLESKSRKENHPPQMLSGKSTSKEKSAEVKGTVSESKCIKKMQPSQILNNESAPSERRSSKEFRSSENASGRNVLMKKHTESKDMDSEHETYKESQSAQTLAGKVISDKKSAKSKDTHSEYKTNESIHSLETPSRNDLGRKSTESKDSKEKGGSVASHQKSDFVRSSGKMINTEKSIPLKNHQHDVQHTQNKQNIKNHPESKLKYKTLPRHISVDGIHPDQNIVPNSVTSFKKSTSLEEPRHLAETTLLSPNSSAGDFFEKSLSSDHLSVAKKKSSSFAGHLSQSSHKHTASQKQSESTGMKNKHSSKEKKIERERSLQEIFNDVASQALQESAILPRKDTDAQSGRKFKSSKSNSSSTEDTQSDDVSKSLKDDSYTGKKRKKSASESENEKSSVAQKKVCQDKFKMNLKENVSLQHTNKEAPPMATKKIKLRKSSGNKTKEELQSIWKSLTSASSSGTTTDNDSDKSQQSKVNNDKNKTYGRSFSKPDVRNDSEFGDNIPDSTSDIPTEEGKAGSDENRNLFTAIFGCQDDFVKLKQGSKLGSDKDSKTKSKHNTDNANCKMPSVRTKEITGSGKQSHVENILTHSESSKSKVEKSNSICSSSKNDKKKLNLQSKKSFESKNAEVSVPMQVATEKNNPLPIEQTSDHLQSQHEIARKVNKTDGFAESTKGAKSNSVECLPTIKYSSKRSHTSDTGTKISSHAPNDHTKEITNSSKQISRTCEEPMKASIENEEPCSGHSKESSLLQILSYEERSASNASDKCYIPQNNGNEKVSDSENSLTKDQSSDIDRQSKAIFSDSLLLIDASDKLSVGNLLSDDDDDEEIKSYYTGVDKSLTTSQTQQDNEKGASKSPSNVGTEFDEGSLKISVASNAKTLSSNKSKNDSKATSATEYLADREKQSIEDVSEQNHSVENTRVPGKCDNVDSTNEQNGKETNTYLQCDSAANTDRQCDEILISGLLCQEQTGTNDNCAKDTDTNEECKKAENNNELCVLTTSTINQCNDTSHINEQCSVTDSTNERSVVISPVIKANEKQKASVSISSTKTNHVVYKVNSDLSVDSTTVHVTSDSKSFSMESIDSASKTCDNSSNAFNEPCDPKQSLPKNLNCESHSNDISSFAATKENSSARDMSELPDITVSDDEDDIEIVNFADYDDYNLSSILPSDSYSQENNESDEIQMKNCDDVNDNGNEVPRQKNTTSCSDEHSTNVSSTVTSNSTLIEAEQLPDSPTEITLSKGEKDDKFLKKSKDCLGNMNYDPHLEKVCKQDVSVSKENENSTQSFVNVSKISVENSKLPSENSEHAISENTNLTICENNKDSTIISNEQTENMSVKSSNNKDPTGAKDCSASPTSEKDNTLNLNTVGCTTLKDSTESQNLADHEVHNKEKEDDVSTSIRNENSSVHTKNDRATGSKDVSGTETSNITTESPERGQHIDDNITNKIAVDNHSADVDDGDENGVSSDIEHASESQLKTLSPVQEEKNIPVSKSAFAVLQSIKELVGPIENQDDTQSTEGAMPSDFMDYLKNMLEPSGNITGGVLNLQENLKTAEFSGGILDKNMTPDEQESVEKSTNTTSDHEADEPHDNHQQEVQSKLTKSTPAILRDLKIVSDDLTTQSTSKACASESHSAKQMSADEKQKFNTCITVVTGSAAKTSGLNTLYSSHSESNTETVTSTDQAILPMSYQSNSNLDDSCSTASDSHLSESNIEKVQTTDQAVLALSYQNEIQHNVDLQQKKIQKLNTEDSTNKLASSQNRSELSASEDNSMIVDDNANATRKASATVSEPNFRSADHVSLGSSSSDQGDSQSNDDIELISAETQLNVQIKKEKMSPCKSGCVMLESASVDENSKISIPFMHTKTYLYDVPDGVRQEPMTACGFLKRDLSVQCSLCKKHYTNLKGYFLHSDKKDKSRVSPESVAVQPTLMDNYTLKNQGEKDLWSHFQSEAKQLAKSFKRIKKSYILLENNKKINPTSEIPSSSNTSQQNQNSRFALNEQQANKLAHIIETSRHLSSENVLQNNSISTSYTNAQPNGQSVPNRALTLNTHPSRPPSQTKPQSSRMQVPTVKDSLQNRLLKDMLSGKQNPGIMTSLNALNQFQNQHENFVPVSVPPQISGNEASCTNRINMNPPQPFKNPHKGMLVPIRAPTRFNTPAASYPPTTVNLDVQQQMNPPVQSVMQESSLIQGQIGLPQVHPAFRPASNVNCMNQTPMSSMQQTQISTDQSSIRSNMPSFSSSMQCSQSASFSSLSNYPQYPQTSEKNCAGNYETISPPAVQISDPSQQQSYSNQAQSLPSCSLAHTAPSPPQTQPRLQNQGGTSNSETRPDTSSADILSAILQPSYKINTLTEALTLWESSITMRRRWLDVESKAKSFLSKSLLEIAKSNQQLQKELEEEKKMKNSLLSLSNISNVHYPGVSQIQNPAYQQSADSRQQMRRSMDGSYNR